MCARYTYNKDTAKLTLWEKLVVYGIVPRGDIRPTDLGPVILPEFEGLAAREFRWGWTVPWDKKPLINAKSETLMTLPTFQPHLEQRCLLPADGFYEGGAYFYKGSDIALRSPGQEGPSDRTAQRSVPTESETFFFGGLWREEAGIKKYTLLTTTPNDSVAPFHDRMPFIIRPDDFKDWVRGDWQRVLNSPDKSPLEKFQKQPELF